MNPSPAPPSASHRSKSVREPGRAASWPWAGFLVAVGYPSLAIFKKMGPGLLVAWVVVMLAAGWIFGRGVGPWLVRQLSPRAALAGLAMMLTGLLSGYLAIHPAIDTDGFQLAGKVFGSSDADDAIEVALDELAAGRFPYRATTFLGNPITPLPGTLLLAAPFHFLADGGAGMQNVFWLAVLWGLIAWVSGRPQVACVLAAGSLALCPTLVYQVLQGTDYLTNGIQVLVCSAALLESVRRGAPWWVRTAASVLLGVALSSRLNFMLGTPLVFLALWRLRGVRGAVGAVWPCVLAFLAVTLPLYFVDPQGFSPLHTVNKLNPDGSTPWAPVAVTMLGLVLAFGLGWCRNSAEFGAWLRNSFIVQFALVLAGFLVMSATTGQPQLALTHFGIFALPFGVAAFGPGMLGIPGSADFSPPQLGKSARMRPK